VQKNHLLRVVQQRRYRALASLTDLNPYLRKIVSHDSSIAIEETSNLTKLDGCDEMFAPDPSHVLVPRLV